MEARGHRSVAQERLPCHNQGRVPAEAPGQQVLHPYYLHILPVLGEHMAEPEDREDAHQGRGQSEGPAGHRDISRPEDGRAGLGGQDEQDRRHAAG